MANAFDVARYILDIHGPMSAMKLQKLAYYCQAWHLVWDEEQLFNESIEAWANGPVCTVLYDVHKGLFSVDSATFSAGRIQNLSDSEKETIHEVIGFYGDKSAQWLSDLTHQESPWLDARNELEPMARSSEKITTASMHEYYSGL